MSNAIQTTQRIEVDANRWSDDSYRHWMREQHPGYAVVFVAKAGTTSGTIYDAGSVIYRNDWIKKR
jgi:hypothetical protein